MENLALSPTSLTILTTFQCTAACKNCCFSCNQKVSKKLNIKEIKRIIDKSFSDFPSIKMIIFTGGEPFLLKEDLMQAVKYVSSLKRMARIVTNCFWASSYKKAYEILLRLKEYGLTEINYSTGDEHQEWVPYDNIVNAIKASVDLNFITAVNIESHYSKLFTQSQMENDLRLLGYIGNPLLKISNGLWMPITEESKKIYANYRKKETIPSLSIGKPCETIYLNLSINPDTQCYSCCGFNCRNIKFLQIGSILEDDFKSKYLSQYDDFMKIWLFLEGPEEIAKFINKHQSEFPINKDNIHPCELCENILLNHLDIIKKHYREIFPRIILKYKMYQNIQKEKQLVN